MMTRNLLLASLLLVAPAFAGADQTDTERLERLAVRMATEPEHHSALAEYFGDRAEFARKEAMRHHEMARVPRETKIRNQIRAGKNCERTAAKYESLAKQYAELAAFHQDHVKRKR